MGGLRSLEVGGPEFHNSNNPLPSGIVQAQIRDSNTGEVLYTFDPEEPLQFYQKEWSSNGRFLVLIPIESEELASQIGVINWTEESIFTIDDETDRWRSDITSLHIWLLSTLSLLHH